jgi:hypothetical protein
MMISIEQAREAVAIEGQLKNWRAAADDAQRITQAQAFGPNGAGLAIRLSPAIVASIKAQRIKEIEAGVAALRRRAAQLGLAMEISL